MARKDIEKYIYELADDMDPSGVNRARYEDYFKPMSDKEFYDYMNNFINDENQNFKIMYPPMSDSSPTISFLTSVAKKRKIPIYQEIFMPYLNKTEDKEKAPGTVRKIMVGTFPVKTLMQTAFAKNTTSTSMTNRNPQTGQVKDSDKSARVSDVEVISLLAQNQYQTAIEYLNPRADDMQMKRQMYAAIASKGEVSMDDMQSDVLNKVSLNTMNYWMLGACFMTNLVDTNGLMLPITMRDREEVKNSQSIK